MAKATKRGCFNGDRDTASPPKAEAIFVPKAIVKIVAEARQAAAPGSRQGGLTEVDFVRRKILQRQKVQ